MSETASVPVDSVPKSDLITSGEIGSVDLPCESPPRFEQLQVFDTTYFPDGSPMNKMKVIECRKNGNVAIITVEAPTIDMMMNSGSKFAYEQRAAAGLPTAGVDPTGGTFPVDVKDPTVRVEVPSGAQYVYRRDFRLMAGPF